MIEVKKAIKKFFAITQGKKNKQEDNEIKTSDLEAKPIYLPSSYGTATINSNKLVEYLNLGDILIIDPTIKKISETGIYVFEYNGHLFVRQFQIMEFGYEEFRNELVYKSVGCYLNDYFLVAKVNVIGAVVSKQIELFHSLYYGSPINGRY